MPRYTNEFGAVVDIPEEKAKRIGGLTPVEPRKKTPPRAAKKTEPTK